MRCIGHLLRLDNQTIARKALKKLVQPCKKPHGRSREIWLKPWKGIYQEKKGGERFMIQDKDS